MSEPRSLVVIDLAELRAVLREIVREVLDERARDGLRQLPQERVVALPARRGLPPAASDLVGPRHGDGT